MSVSLIDYVAGLDGVSGTSATEREVYETIEQIIRVKKGDPNLSCDEYKRCDKIGRSLIRKIELPPDVNPMHRPETILADLKKTLHAEQVAALVLDDLDGNPGCTETLFSERPF